LAYEFKSAGDVLKYATEGTIAIPGTLTNTGITADADGRKIVPAGTALESNSSGTIIGTGDAAKACTDYTGADAEAILRTDTDVTDGNETASFLIAGSVAGALCPHFKYGSVAALKANGLNLIGSYTQEDNPILTFTAVASTNAANAKVATVSPTLTDGNSYLVAVGKALPPVGTDLTGVAGWSAYTLGTDIAAATASVVVIAEIDGDGVVVKCGYDACVAGATPPVLTFVCTDHATASSTQIASVDPAATGANTYMVGNATVSTLVVPAVGADLTGVSGWAAYTLTDAIAATDEDEMILVEVSTGDIVVKCGQAVAVVA